MGFPSLDLAFRWIESFTNLERSTALYNPRTYQLERMRLLAAVCGNPQNACRAVHLAGTKGKGSTAVLIAEGLRHSGLRVGLYTSPHVSDYRERIRLLDGGLRSAGASSQSAGGDALPRTSEAEFEPLVLEQAEGLRATVESAAAAETLGHHGPPSTFELLTLLAFCSFRAAGCDIAVVETGIGGRLDATNLLTPELAVITPIELEHTEVLGDTLEAIAGEKAGIIKPGVPVISSPQHSAAAAVLRATAGRHHSPITFVPEELEITELSCSPEGTRVELKLKNGTTQALRLALIGNHQGENAALAYLCLRRLGVSAGAVESGFAVAVLPARMELLRRFPPVVLDGAHTPRSVARVLESFRSVFGGRGVLLFGAAADKRIEEMAAVLAPAFRAIVITATGSLRESHPREIFDRFGALNPASELVPEPAAALERALERCGEEFPLLITGSFYLAGEVRRAWMGRSLAPAPGAERDAGTHGSGTGR